MSLTFALGAALLATGEQLLVLLGPLALLVVGLNLSSTALQLAAVRLLGWRAFLIAFGWLGTAVHELSHALFCVLFGHKITELRLFDPRASGGGLGYVRHAYDARNPVQQIGNLFIGLAPILVGGAALTAAAIALFGGGDLGVLSGEAVPRPSGEWGGSAIAARTFDAVHALAATVLSGRASPLRAVAFCYLVIAIGGLMGMSREDAKGALPGAALAAALLLAANLASALLGHGTLTGLVWRAALVVATAHAVLIAAIAIDLAAALALFLIAVAFRR
jgi:hypothetical protein